DVVDQRVEEALELVDRGGAGQTDAGFRGLGIVCVHESTVPDISYRVCQTEPGEDTPDFHTAAAYATLIVRSDARDHPWANIRSSIVGIAGGRRWKPWKVMSADVGIARAPSSSRFTIPPRKSRSRRLRRTESTSRRRSTMPDPPAERLSAP